MIKSKISFRDIPSSDALTQNIEERINKLERYYDRITSCQVIVSSPTKHHHTKGTIYHVELIMHVPGTELIVSHEPEKNHAHEDPYIAVRDAFQALERQLKEYVSRKRDIDNRAIREAGRAETA